MAQLDTNLTGTISLTQQNSVLTFSTQTKYVPKNITMNINIPGIVIPKPTSGYNNFYITVPNGGNNTVTFYFNIDSNGNTTVTDSSI